MYIINYELIVDLGIISVLLNRFLQSSYINLKLWFSDTKKIPLKLEEIKMAIITIPVSWGELLDKITILEIKSERIKSEDSLINVHNELALLNEKLANEMILSGNIIELKKCLKHINTTLWDVEDALREKEANNEFDANFIELARSAYKNNDERAHIKRKINILLSSNLIEEKSYPF